MHDHGSGHDIMKKCLADVRRMPFFDSELWWDYIIYSDGRFDDDNKGKIPPIREWMRVHRVCNPPVNNRESPTGGMVHT